jgi:hypothetical protein
MSCHGHLLPPTNFETYLFFNETVPWHAVFHFVGVHYPSHGMLNGFTDFCALPEGRWRSTYNEAVRQILTYIVVVFLTHSLVQKSAQFFGQILMQKKDLWVSIAFLEAMGRLSHSMLTSTQEAWLSRLELVASSFELGWMQTLHYSLNFHNSRVWNQKTFLVPICTKKNAYYLVLQQPVPEWVWVICD